MRKIAVTLILSSIILSSMFIYRQNREDDPVVPVSILTLTAADIYDTVRASGQIEETEIHNIYADGAVRISELYISEGDRVEKNQILMEVVYTGGDNALPNELQNIEEIISVLSSFGISYDSAKEMYSQIINEADLYIPGEAVKTGETAFIMSPIDGVITKLYAEKGGAVRNGALYASVSDFSKLSLKASLPENLIGEICEGMPVTITAEAFKDASYSGYVERIMPTAKQNVSLTGSQSVTVDVMISIDDQDGLLKPGYSANARIYKCLRPDAITVPYEAVLQDSDNREAVFVVKNGRAVKTFIKTGLELDDSVEVSLGLKPGDVIVRNPGMEITNGVRVMEMGETD